MNIRRISRLLIAAALMFPLSSPLAASTNTDASLADSIQAAPSKTCHPKKPATCRTADLFVAEAETATFALPLVDVEPTAAAQLATGEVQAACFGPRHYLCRSTDLGAAGNEASEQLPVVPVTDAPVAIEGSTPLQLANAVQAACFGPRHYLCRSGMVL